MTSDGEICHRRRSVNIHDVIFSLKGRSGDRLCCFDARARGFFFVSLFICVLVSRETAKRSFSAGVIRFLSKTQI